MSLRICRYSERLIQIFDQEEIVMPALIWYTGDENLETVWKAWKKKRGSNSFNFVLATDGQNAKPKVDDASVQQRMMLVYIRTGDDKTAPMDGKSSGVVNLFAPASNGPSPDVIIIPTRRINATLDSNSTIVTGSTIADDKNTDFTAYLPFTVSRDDKARQDRLVAIKKDIVTKAKNRINKYAFYLADSKQLHRVIDEALTKLTPREEPAPAPAKTELELTVVSGAEIASSDSKDSKTTPSSTSSSSSSREPGSSAAAAATAAAAPLAFPPRSREKASSFFNTRTAGATKKYYRLDDPETAAEPQSEQSTGCADWLKKYFKCCK